MENQIDTNPVNTDTKNYELKLKKFEKIARVCFIAAIIILIISMIASICVSMQIIKNDVLETLFEIMNQFPLILIIVAILAYINTKKIAKKIDNANQNSQVQEDIKVKSSSDLLDVAYKINLTTLIASAVILVCFICCILGIHSEIIYTVALYMFFLAPIYIILLILSSNVVPILLILSFKHNPKKPIWIITLIISIAAIIFVSIICVSGVNSQKKFDDFEAGLKANNTTSEE